MRGLAVSHLPNLNHNSGAGIEWGTWMHIVVYLREDQLSLGRYLVLALNLVFICFLVIAESCTDGRGELRSGEYCGAFTCLYSLVVSPKISFSS